MIYFGHRMALLRGWEGSKQLRIFPVWWGFVFAFGWDTLTGWPVVSYASRAALIASSFEMSSQWLGERMGLTEWTCSSVVELAKSLFVCYAASNDITWFSTKARLKGGSSGFGWPSLWNMSSRKRLKDSLRPKRNLPLINSSAFMPNDNLPTAVLKPFLLRWNGGLVCLWHAQ